MVLTDEKLARLREAAGKATPGPWDCDDSGVVYTDRSVNLAVCDAWAPVDGAFIAEADPATLLALLDRLMAAETRHGNLALDIECHYKPELATLRARVAHLEGAAAQAEQMQDAAKKKLRYEREYGPPEGTPAFEHLARVTHDLDRSRSRVQEMKDQRDAVIHAHAIESDHCEDDVVRAIVERQSKTIVELVAVRAARDQRVDELTADCAVFAQNFRDMDEVINELDGDLSAKILECDQLAAKVRELEGDAVDRESMVEKVREVLDCSTTMSAPDLTREIEAVLPPRDAMVDPLPTPHKMESP